MQFGFVLFFQIEDPMVDQVFLLLFREAQQLEFQILISYCLSRPWSEFDPDCFFSLKCSHDCLFLIRKRNVELAAPVDPFFL